MESLNYIAPLERLFGGVVSWWLFLRDDTTGVESFMRTIEINPHEQVMLYSYVGGISLWRI